MKKHIKVVAGLISDNNHFFICQRSENMTLPNYWEFPGGKVEEGETNEEALRRELIEELRCDVNVGELLAENYHEYDDFTLDLLVYECTLNERVPVITEHSASNWIPIEEFDDYLFAPADWPAIKKVKEKYL